MSLVLLLNEIKAIKMLNIVEIKNLKNIFMLSMTLMYKNLHQLFVIYLNSISKAENNCVHDDFKERKKIKENGSGT